MPETDPPSPKTVGSSFMRQYYHFLAKEPQSLHRFYKDESRWCHGVGSHMEQPIAGQKAINEQILKRGYDGARVDLDAGSIDCQDSLDGGVLVLVTGVMTLRNSPPKPFVQTFFLAVQPNGYFVLNDSLRFLELPGAGADDAPSSPVNGKESPKKLLSPKKAPVSPVKQTATVASSPVKTVKEKPATPVKVESPVKSPVKEKTPSPVKKTPSPVKEKTPSPKKESPKKESPKKVEKVEKPAPVAAPADPVVPAPAEPEKPKTWAALFGPKSTSAAVTPSSAAAPASAPTKPETPKAAASPAPAPAAIAPATGAPAPEKSPKNKGGNGKDKESRPRYFSLFLRNVPSQTRDNDLRELFKSYGTIAGVNVVNNRGFAFVDYVEEKSMRAALAETNEFKLFDKVLQVDERTERKEGQRGGFRNNDSRGRGRGHGPKGGRGDRKERNNDDAPANTGERREARREKTGNRRGGKVDGAPHSRAD